jgi:hypothetical protein
MKLFKVAIPTYLHALAMVVVKRGIEPLEAHPFSKLEEMVQVVHFVDKGSFSVKLSE